jgi:hypothetical protein
MTLLSCEDAYMQVCMHACMQYMEIVWGRSGVTMYYDITFCM